MHRTFLVTGTGERSGSGIPRILSGWKWANQRISRLYEKTRPEQTLLKLSIDNLVSEEIANLLHTKFGGKVDHLSKLERSIVITVAVEKWVDHERACQLTSLHFHEVTLALPRPVSDGFLVPHGEKRDKSCALPGQGLPSPEEAFDVSPLSTDNSFANKAQIITGNGSLIADNGELITDSKKERDALDRFITEKLSFPYVNNPECLSPTLRRQLGDISALAREKKRLSDETMGEIILKFCSGHYMPLSVTVKLVIRILQNLREKQLAPLIRSGKIELAFSHARGHKRQGYISCEQV